jgi:hypothetical protein
MPTGAYFLYERPENAEQFLSAAQKNRLNEIRERLEQLKQSAQPYAESDIEEPILDHPDFDNPFRKAMRQSKMSAKDFESWSEIQSNRRQQW